MGQGPQKPDHGGNFFMTPRRVTASLAWRHASYRARSILQVFQHAFDGYNNGEIAFGIREIGTAIGDQNHAANSRAVAELIELGLLECTSDANRVQSKVRTYRITFISTGKARNIVPATHEYDSWRPVKKRKFGGARTATQNRESVAVTATTVKDSVVVTATQMTESRGFEGAGCVAVTASLLDNHSRGAPEPVKLSLSHVKIPAADLRTELATLRQWAHQVLAHLGYGGARQLAADAGIPEVALSRFRSGKGLPEQYRVPLQHACARVIPFNKFTAMLEAA
jgi:hypothetical protein